MVIDPAPAMLHLHIRQGDHGKTTLAAAVAAMHEAVPVLVVGETDTLGLIELLERATRESTPFPKAMVERMSEACPEPDSEQFGRRSKGDKHRNRAGRWR